jgi:hypothetical protein
LGAAGGKGNVAGISEADAYELLCFNWGTAYDITYRLGLPRPYRATRKDDRTTVLAADTPDELSDLILPDYQAKPVPREIAP